MLVKTCVQLPSPVLEHISPFCLPDIQAFFQFFAHTMLLSTTGLLFVRLLLPVKVFLSIVTELWPIFPLNFSNLVTSSGILFQITLSWKIPLL